MFDIMVKVNCVICTILLIMFVVLKGSYDAISCFSLSLERFAHI